MDEPALKWIYLCPGFTTGLLPMDMFLQFIMGFSLVMALSTLFKSAVNGWERANLYCALLFTCSFINCACWMVGFDVARYGFYSPTATETNPGLWFNHLNPVFLLLLHRSFLNIRKESARTYKWITFFIRAVLLMVVVEVVFTFLPAYSYVFTTANLLLLILLFPAFVILLVYALRFWWHPIFRYAAWSTWMIFLLYSVNFVAFLFSWEKYFPPWVLGNILYIILIIDGILFLLALTLRDRQVLVDKMRLEQQAILIELKALRAQMNPHFIFNCLNSIKSFTLNHNMQDASYYLTRFSKLIRRVLENSGNEKIALESELETLALYLEMEKMRAGDQFEYEINVAENVETEFIQVPPTLLQPYVENAIWHGLMPKETAGKLTIDITQNDYKYLMMTVTDNGIGREKAAELKSGSGSAHTSFGMKINRERLNGIQDLYQREAKIAVEDLTYPDHTAAGTKVSLTIPLEHGA